MLNAEQIRREYERAVSYNDAINLYRNVEDNEDFYIGNQWKGIHAPDIPKPVINILKRCVTYFLATLISDDIGVSFESFQDDKESEELMRLFQRDIDRIFEKDHTKAKFRHILRNAAVDGDGVLYFYWDDNVKTHEAARGDVRTVVVPNINVLFGNPYEPDAQKQEYILMLDRKTVGAAKRMAEKWGGDADGIVPDNDDHQGEQGRDNEMVTVITRLFKENGTIHAVQSTLTAIVRPEWDIGIERYPLSWMRWDRVRNGYHGQAALTGMIPNQIQINKMMAMYLRSIEMNAFPKIVYDKQKFRNGWSNRVGEAIGVMGDVGQAAVNVLRGGDVSNQVIEAIHTVMQLTQECIGVNDAAMGNINPANAAASAIIATQQASAAPLELQRQEYFDFCEQTVLNVLAFMAEYYGSREVLVETKAEAQVDPMTGMALEGEETKEKRRVDYGRIRTMISDTNVSIGSSAYWSELAQMQTMDNLLQAGIITDKEVYVESIPDKWLPAKQQLLESIRKEVEQQMQAAQQQMSAAGLAQGVEQPAKQGPEGANTAIPSGTNLFESML